MSSKYFLDTNILIYADDRTAGRKQDLAIRIVTEGMKSKKAVVSTQVLQEYFVNATKKLNIPAVEVKRKIGLLSCLEVVRIRVEDILDAIDLHRLHQISLWDALIICCAAGSGCDRVLTEDLQHGQVISGVKIENPFRERD